MSDIKRLFLSTYIRLRNKFIRKEKHPSKDASLAKLGLLDVEVLLQKANSHFQTGYRLVGEKEEYVLLSDGRRIEHTIDWMVPEVVYATLDVNGHIPPNWKFSLWK